MDKDFQFIQQLTETLCGLQVHWLQNTREAALQLMGQMFQDLVPVNFSEAVLLRVLHTLEPGCIYELASGLELQYTLFRYEKSGHFLVLGPCRTEGYTEKAATEFLRAQGLKDGRIRQVLAFCGQQPEVSYEKLHRVTVLMVQRLLGSSDPVPYQKLENPWNQAESQQIPDLENFDELEHIRRIESRYEASAALTEAVKHGNLSLAYRYILQMNTVPEDLTRNPDSLRNAQNLCIILNTQLRHAMEEIGVQPYRLDQLSGGIARQIERIKTHSAINAYFGEIIRQYCQLAQEKDQLHLTPFARLAVTYIQSHLSDNLTVKEAAKALLVNPDYLSAQFHKQVGVPFITYVNQQRVKQAAALLRRTDLQVQQVASAVGYNNTSYFAKQFVHFMGQTPREYRQKYKI